MFRYFYAVTKDKKGDLHQYKLGAGEGVPKGHEITALSVASQFKLVDHLAADCAKAMWKLQETLRKVKRGSKE